MTVKVGTLFMSGNLQWQEKERDDSKHSDGFSMVLLENLDGLLDIFLQSCGFLPERQQIGVDGRSLVHV